MHRGQNLVPFVLKKGSGHQASKAAVLESDFLQTHQKIADKGVEWGWLGAIVVESGVFFFLGSGRLRKMLLIRPPEEASGP